MKKLIISLILCFSLLGSVCYAEEYVNVVVNNNKLEFDVPAQIINDRTMVPMRGIFESFGAKVQWVEEQELIIASKGDTMVVMRIGSDVMLVANLTTGIDTQVILDVPPMLLNDRTLVPVRAVSESFGLNVEWDEESQTVFITSVN